MGSRLFALIVLCATGVVCAHGAGDARAEDPVADPVEVLGDQPEVLQVQHVASIPVEQAVEQAVVEAAFDSVSCGASNRGSLSNAAEMPQRGVGFEIPEPWWSRGYRYGTSELTGLLARAAAAVEAEHPGGILGVADLSKPTGGALPGHRSHQSGRDADLIFYALDAAGKPFVPDSHMPYYARDGRAYYARAPHWSRSIPERYFDLARNWALVKALMSDDQVEIESMFVSTRVRRWLIAYARATSEPDEVINRAARLVKRVRGRSHNDHMHVRITCSKDDIAAGRCRNDLASQRRNGRKWRSRIRCPARPTAGQP